MINIVPVNINRFFKHGHERTINIKKNVVFSFFLKSCSVVTSFFLVSITLKYVEPFQYGIWITLSSVVTWFGFLDIGFGVGLKNKLTEAFATGNERLARVYISTAYATLTILALLSFFCFAIINHLLYWPGILNTPSSFSKELSTVSLTVFGFFCTQFVLQIITTISAAKQHSSLQPLVVFLGNFLSLTIIYFLVKTTNGSLIYLCMSIGIPPALVLFFTTIYLFKTKYKCYLPTFSLADFSLVKDILRLGIKFFFIQVGMIFFYSVDTIIISRILGPEAVTTYNIAFKYFAIITVISGIIMSPFWPAFTDANTKKDYLWIKNTVKSLKKICFLAFLFSLFLVFISQKVYSLWVGDRIQVPLSLSAVLALYTSLNMFRTIYCYYLNGVGKVHLQMILIGTSGLLNIPMAVFLGKSLGITGVILSTTILSALCGIFEVTQYRKLINLSATGIWNK